MKKIDKIRYLRIGVMILPIVAFGALLGQTMGISEPKLELKTEASQNRSPLDLVLFSAYGELLVTSNSSSFSIKSRHCSRLKIVGGVS